MTTGPLPLLICGGRWDINSDRDGFTVRYTNLIKGLVFDCGTATNSNLNDVLLFVALEADPGDFILVDGVNHAYVVPAASSD